MLNFLSNKYQQMFFLDKTGLIREVIIIIAMFGNSFYCRVPKKMKTLMFCRTHIQNELLSQLKSEIPQSKIPS